MSTKPTPDEYRAFCLGAFAMMLAAIVAWTYWYTANVEVPVIKPDNVVWAERHLYIQPSTESDYQYQQRGARVCATIYLQGYWYGNKIYCAHKDETLPTNIWVKRE